jgi:hypothetical protein
MPWVQALILQTNKKVYLCAIISLCFFWWTHENELRLSTEYHTSLKFAKFRRYLFGNRTYDYILSLSLQKWIDVCI